MSTVDRIRLSDIVASQHRDQLTRAWDATEPASDYGALPKGEYIARIVEGELKLASKGTPGYRLTFEVSEGEFAGRRFWHTVWFTPAALPMAKRDLLKLGVSRLEQLENPLPGHIRCRVQLAQWVDDNGLKENCVRSFEVIGMDALEADPFAPAPQP